MKTNKIIYWIATSVVILMVGVVSIGDLLKIEALKEAMQHIRFPDYVLPLFGTLKILGTLCIVVPALKRFREVAYAGIFYFFAGAVYCHVANGDELGRTLVPLIVLGISITSYVFSKKVLVF